MPEETSEKKDAAAARDKQSYNLQDASLYINRELGLLEFQRRVLDEAKDERNPLLERIKFLSIVDSNLDEFFMVRVSGLRMQKNAGVAELSIDGLTPGRQLAKIRKVAMKLMQESREYFNKTLMPLLDKNGIRILNYKDLSSQQRGYADRYFLENIFPVLTPLAYDPSHPFPHISNLSLNLAVVVQDKDSTQRFARVKVPFTLPVLVPLKRSSGGSRRDGTVPYTHYFVWLVQVINANLGQLFPGLDIMESHPFHITRNADMQIQELEAQDLLDTMEESVRRRRFGEVVRLLITEKMPRSIRDILEENLEVDANDVYVLDIPLELSSLTQLTRVERFDLKDRSFTPATPAILRSGPEDEPNSIFSIIREKNILLHHPYDSFNPVIEFLRLSLIHI